MNTVTGQKIQNHIFGRRPFVGTALHLQNDERVTAARVDTGKPAHGSFVTPVEVWVTLKA